MVIVMPNGFALASGKVPNPAKAFYLGLSAGVVRVIDAMGDADGVCYARNAMIRTGMELNVNGQWEELQSVMKLQKIVDKYRNHFHGAPVIDEHRQ